MENRNLENRVSSAIGLFEEGYNCSQAVFMAYADIYDIDVQTAAKLASSFGGGMGRLREVCGAVTGMFLVLGLHYPFTDTTDKAAKDTNYKAVQRTANAFKEVMGSYICADLLKIKQEPQAPESSVRDAAYYQLRPCARCVAVAAEIVGKELLSGHSE
ncbi:MAG: C-GCAxxG-C-C family protein [Bacteroidota bacterium]|nr:C-GCAxxG-C-C family protein [Bacteroidota bacterium]